MSLKQAADQIIRQIENPEGRSVPVFFYERARYNEEESKKQGRPVYDNAIYVKKHISKLSVYDSPARDDDIQQNRAAYDAYLAQKKDRASGVPIGMLPGITPVELGRCEACKVWTVEKLAEADDGLLRDIGNEELKERAVLYLKGGDEKDAKIRELEAKIKELENDSSINSSKRGGRNAAVRETGDGSK